MIGVGDYITKTCAICGKEIIVRGLDSWAYKIKTPKGTWKWFCSYKHKRAYEAEHPEKKIYIQTVEIREPKDPQNRKDVAEELALVIRDGGNVIKYLQEKGYKNAYQAYDAIRHYCSTKAPALALILKPLKELRKMGR